MLRPSLTPRPYLLCAKSKSQRVAVIVDLCFTVGVPLDNTIFPLQVRCQCDCSFLKTLFLFVA